MGKGSGRRKHNDKAEKAYRENPFWNKPKEKKVK